MVRPFCYCLQRPAHIALRSSIPLLPSLIIKRLFGVVMRRVYPFSSIKQTFNAPVLSATRFRGSMITYAVYLPTRAS